MENTQQADQTLDGGNIQEWSVFTDHKHWVP